MAKRKKRRLKKSVKRFLYASAALACAILLAPHSSSKTANTIKNMYAVNAEEPVLSDTTISGQDTIAAKNTALYSVPTVGVELTEVKEGDSLIAIGSDNYGHVKVCTTSGIIGYVGLDDIAVVEQESMSADESTYEIVDELADTGEADTAVAEENSDAEVIGADVIVEETAYAAEEVSSSWTGAVLTASAGTVQGPSGKETYYNLDMSGIVSIMRSMGNTDEYWVRDDGVKMLGDYVMVAADLSLRPRGSLIETSLGTGIVVDTGSFIYSNPTQLDIAVTW